MRVLRWLIVANLVGTLEARRKRGGPRDEMGAPPKKTLKDRLEKFDRLYEMAQKGKAEIPGLRERIEELKGREATLMENEESLETPKMPVLEGNPFSHDPSDMDDDRRERMMPGMDEEDDPKQLTPEEQAARKEHMEKNKARLEKMRAMSTEERMAFLKEERERAAVERKASGEAMPSPEDMDPMTMFGGKGRGNKPWKSKNGDFGPPLPKDSKREKRREEMLKLTKEERHTHIRAHQAAMQQHRENMESWRETHASYMDERRDIMDQYRSISHEIREAIFASKDL